MEILSKRKRKKLLDTGEKRYDYSGGNPWGGISADLERKILYISTGNAGRFYEGTSRPGKNKYSNSIIALILKNENCYGNFKR